MIDPNTKSTPPTQAPSPKKKSPALTRIIVSGTVVAASLAAVGIAIPWAAYRYRHIVVGEAVIKGTVTQVGSRIEGRIKSVEVEIGQRVSKDQVLLKLDDSHFKAEVERSRAQLKSALSDLESEKLAIAQSFDSIIPLNSSRDTFPLPIFNIVAVNALTMPLRKRLALTRYTKQSPSYTHSLSIIEHSNDLTCVFRFEKAEKSV